MPVFLLAGFALMYLNGTLGMGYGTLLAPALLLVGVGYDETVQAILLSQGVASLFLAASHHRDRNSEFRLAWFWPGWKGIRYGLRHGNVLAALRRRSSHELKAAAAMVALGLAAVALGAWLSGVVPVPWLRRYLGAVVVVAGVFMLLGLRSAFRPWKLLLLTAVGSLNKVLTGGGFGPLLTGGQVVLGEDGKRAVGISAAVQAPLALAGYLALGVVHGFGDPRPVALPLLVGAVVAAPLASRSVALASSRSVHAAMGLAMIALGLAAALV